MSDEEEEHVPRIIDKRGGAKPPPMPEGIVLHKADGEAIVCEPAYRGLDDEGRWVWDVMTEVGPGDRLTVVQWPPRTVIEFPNKHPDLEAHRTVKETPDGDA
jgi:hypothetical protein